MIQLLFNYRYGLTLAITTLQGLLIASDSLATPIQTSCSQVDIRAVKKIDGLTYEQHGLGHVFYWQSSHGASTQVLVNEHVIDQADEVFIRCGQIEVKAKIHGASPTIDLATLKIEDRNLIQDGLPVFQHAYYLNSRDSHYPDPFPIPLDSAAKKLRIEAGTSAGRFDFYPDPENRSYDGHGNQTLIPNTPLIPMAGTKNIIVLNRTGARPGMSGAIISRENSSFPFGIVSRTVAWDQRTLGIPFSEIVQALKNGLGDGRDPFASDKSRPAYLTTAPYQRDSRNLVLQRKYQLRIRSTSESETILEDACTSKAYGQVSRWQEVGHYHSPGGHYHSPGSPQNSKDLGDLAVQTWGNMDPNALSVYRSLYLPESDSTECSQEGVRLPNGRILVGLKGQQVGQEHQSTFKIDSVQQLFGLLEKKGASAFLNEIERNGIFAQDPKSSFSALCETSLFMDHVQALSESRQTGCFRVSYHSAEALFRTRLDVLGAVVTKVNHPQAYGSKLTCDRAQGRIELDSPSGRNEPLGLHFQMTAHRIQGSVKLGRCEVKNIDQEKQFWSGNLHTQDFDLSVDLSYDPFSSLEYPQLLIEVRPLRVDPKCLKGISSLSPSTPLLSQYLWRVE